MTHSTPTPTPTLLQFPAQPRVNPAQAGVFRPLKAGFAAVALALLAHVPAQATTDADFAPAFARFAQATAGDASAIAPAAQAFGQLLTVEPTNPVLLAYSGAATSLQATTTWLPWKKLGHAEDGLAQLDKALALLTPAHNAPWQRGTPAVLEVKLVAANTFLAVPGFMNRHERGERLLKEVLTSPLLAGAPAEFRTAVDKAAKSAQLVPAATVANTNTSTNTNTNGAATHAAPVATATATNANAAPVSTAQSVPNKK